jgi:hypothetical protein
VSKGCLNPLAQVIGRTLSCMGCPNLSAQGFQTIQFGLTLRTGWKVLGDDDRLSAIQSAIPPGANLGQVFACHDDRLEIRMDRNCARARDKRDMTVPMGIANSLAIASYENSSTSRKSKIIFNPSGKPPSAV